MLARPWLACASALALTLALLPAQEPRLHTSRTTGAQLLKLPKEDDAFGFVVFGDRTGGQPEGIGRSVIKEVGVQRQPGGLPRSSHP